MAPQTARITLYWLNKSRAQRILWLLEELKVQYELKTFERGSDMLAPPELKEVHPLGKSPVVTVQSTPEANPIVLAESSFIAEYLIDHFGPQLAPQRYQKGKDGQAGGETEEWMRYRYYLHYNEGSLMPLLVTSLICRNIRNSPVPFFIKPITNRVAGGIETNYIDPNLKTHFAFLESQLATAPNSGEYLCGQELTGADILMSFPITASKAGGNFTKEKYPKLWAYAEKLENEEGYKKAVQKIVEVEGKYEPII